MSSPRLLLALVLGLALLAPRVCWSQSPGLTDPMVTPRDEAPTTLPSPSPVQSSWGLPELLWGLARLQESPWRLSARQRGRVRPPLVRVVEGSQTLKTFETRVKELLTTDQASFLQHLAAEGKLASDPTDLPMGAPGQDPLVQHVLQILQERARR